MSLVFRITVFHLNCCFNDLDPPVCSFVQPGALLDEGTCPLCRRLLNLQQWSTLLRCFIDQGSEDYGLCGGCRVILNYPSAFSCRSRAVTCRADGGLGAGGAGGCSMTRSGFTRPPSLPAVLQKQTLTPPSLLLSGPPK